MDILYNSGHVYVLLLYFNLYNISDIEHLLHALCIEMKILLTPVILFNRQKLHEKVIDNRMWLCIQ